MSMSLHITHLAVGWCYYGFNSTFLPDPCKPSAIGDIEGVTVEQNGIEESVAKKKKKKKKKKKPAEASQDDELPSGVDGTETKENGEENPGL